MAVDLSMSVLVVDDYNTMIRIIRNLLKQLGFEHIDDASDGSAALNKMRGKKYGLVISDWNMEPMSGYDLLREVRADPNLATTPFIMITAESKTENVIAAKKAGVNNYIVKPYTCPPTCGVKSGRNQHGPGVVPANAGTHNHMRCLLRMASATVLKRDATAYGSRRTRLCEKSDS